MSATIKAAVESKSGGLAVKIEVIPAGEFEHVKLAALLAKGEFFCKNTSVGDNLSFTVELLPAAKTKKARVPTMAEVASAASPEAAPEGV